MQFIVLVFDLFISRKNQFFLLSLFSFVFTYYAHANELVLLLSFKNSEKHNFFSCIQYPALSLTIWDQQNTKYKQLSYKIIS